MLINADIQTAVNSGDAKMLLMEPIKRVPSSRLSRKNAIRKIKEHRKSPLASEEQSDVSIQVLAEENYDDINNISVFIDDHLSLLPDNDTIELISSLPVMPAHHCCLSEEEDPLLGIFTDKGSCCGLKALLDLPDNPNECAPFLTPFGRHLDYSTALFDAYSKFELCKYSSSDKENFLFYLRNCLVAADLNANDDKVIWRFDSCSVCCCSFRLIREPPCCRAAICQLCWEQHVRTTAGNSVVAVNVTGMYDLHCFNCSRFVPYAEALASLDPVDLALIRPAGFASSSTAHCPVCLVAPPPLLVVKTKENQTTLAERLRKKRGGRPVECERCHHKYCGMCGQEEHPRLSCKQLTASEKGYRKWSKQKSAEKEEFPNARKCPACKIPVNHNGGCRHMTCPCGQEFCFACGGKYFKRRFIVGRHFCLKQKSHPVIKRCAIYAAIGVGVIPFAIVLSPIIATVGIGILLAEKYKTRRQ